MTRSSRHGTFGKRNYDEIGNGKRETQRKTERERALMSYQVLI